MNKMTEEHKKVVEEMITKMNHEINFKLEHSKKPEEEIYESVAGKWFHHIMNRIKDVDRDELLNAMVEELDRQEELGLDIRA